MSDLNDHIAKTIFRLRKPEHGPGLSQEALARKVGTTANTISRWETGTYRPTAVELDRLARAFKVSITVFFPTSQDGEVTETRRQALLSSLGDLSDAEMEEIRRYAEFRKAVRTLGTAKKQKSKKKDE